MQQNLKFVSLIGALRVDEWLAFQKYLKKVHGEETVAWSVFAYYKPLILKGAGMEKLDPILAYRKLFGKDIPDLELARKKILNALSDLHGWLKDFLLTEKMRSDTPEVQLLWLDILRERGLRTEYARLSTRLYQNCLEQALPDEDACIQKISIGQHYKWQLVQDNPDPDFETLTDCSSRMRHCAETLHLKMACEVLNNQKLRPELMKLTPEEPPLLRIYQKVHHLLHTEQVALYFEVMSLLQAHAGQIDMGEVLVIVRFLHNFAAPKIRSGQGNVWGKQLHELNKISLQSGLYTQKGFMSPPNFCNIVNAACFCGATDWALAFVADYAPFLPEDARQETVQLSLAIIAFEQKAFKKALQHLEASPAKLVNNILRSKVLKLRTLYELDPTDDTLPERCLNFEAFLLRHRKPKTEVIEASLAFVRLFKLFLHPRLTQAQLQERIEGTEVVYCKEWLLEKVGGYRGRYGRR